MHLTSNMYAVMLHVCSSWCHLSNRLLVSFTLDLRVHLLGYRTHIARARCSAAAVFSSQFRKALLQDRALHSLSPHVQLHTRAQLWLNSLLPPSWPALGQHLPISLIFWCGSRWLWHPLAWGVRLWSPMLLLCCGHFHQVPWVGFAWVTTSAMRRAGQLPSWISSHARRRQRQNSSTCKKCPKFCSVSSRTTRTGSRSMQAHGLLVFLSTSHLPWPRHWRHRARSGLGILVPDTALVEPSSVAGERSRRRS